MTSKECDKAVEMYLRDRAIMPMNGHLNLRPNATKHFGIFDSKSGKVCADEFETKVSASYFLHNNKFILAERHNISEANLIIKEII